jgi:hypothetical protein
MLEIILLDDVLLKPRNPKGFAIVFESLSKGFPVSFHFRNSE